MNDYPLATLRKIREQERDQAEQAYAETLRDQERLAAQVRQEEARLESARQAVVSAQEEARRARSGDEILMTDIGLHREFERALKDDVVRAEESVRTAERAAQEHQKSVVQKALKAFQEAQKAVMAVEKHFEGWKAEQDLEADRKAADALDEIAIRGWSKQ